MSSTTNDPTGPAPLASRVLTPLFALSVLVFLLGGLVIVIGQSVYLAWGSADGAREWRDTVTLFAFGGASVAGLLAFGLSYWHREDEDGLHETADEPVRLSGAGDEARP